jgi:hypothetical protein
MTDTPQLLLAHHLKTLRLPTFLREYDKLARQCAAEGADHVRYLVRLAELELIDRERRMVERRIRQARFPAVKSLDAFELAFFEKISVEWRGEQDHCLRDIERHQVADRSYLEDGVRLIELSQNAQRLFEKQDSREKRRLLNFLVSNSSWQDGELTSTLRQPFDLIAETTAIEAKRKAAGGISNDLSVNWLPGPDSNQRQGG